MATFALFLTAAMMRLEPPTDWNDIVELALRQINATSRRNYCTNQLHKALEVGLRFGIIKALKGKYYLNEYGKIDEEGNVSYDFDTSTFDQLADVSLSEEDLTRNEFETMTNRYSEITEMLNIWKRVGLRVDELILRDLFQMNMHVDQTETVESQNINSQNGNEAQISSEIEANQLLEVNENVNQAATIEDQHNSTEKKNEPEKSVENEDNSDDLGVISEDSEMNHSIFFEIPNTSDSEDFDYFMGNLINELSNTAQSAEHLREFQEFIIKNGCINKMVKHFPLKRKMLTECERYVKRLKTN